MSHKTIEPGLYQISLGFVNAFLVEADGELMLIDTGTADSPEKITAAVQQLGKHTNDIRRIVLTHLHTDHTGGLAALKQASGAEVYAHAFEAPAIRAGEAMRPVEPGPGVMSKLTARFAGKSQLFPALPAVAVEHELQDGDVLPGGWTIVHTPGHTRGHICLKRDRTLILGDAATIWFRLGGPPLYENYAEAQRSLQRIAALEFERACFSHGKPILQSAAQKFRQKWA
ncbi:MAG: MBL fold metallo-hydrolase [Chloroflexota bacterium]